VLFATYSIEGRVLPTVRGQQQVETRPDMRRTDSLASLDNRFLKSVVGDTRSADIVRLDKKLVWTLDPSKLKYKECPLTGCNPRKQLAADKPAPPERPEQTCPLTLTRNDFKVQATGEHKTINAFNTEHFRANWTVELTDPQKHTGVNNVVLDLWTTPEVGAIHDLRSIDESYQKRWQAALGAPDHPFAHYVPRDVMESLGALTGTPGGTRNLAAWIGEMKKVHGYPIALTLAWSVSGNTCSDGTQANSSGHGGSSVPTSPGGLLGSLIGGLAQDKAKDMAGNSGGTVLTYSYEANRLLSDRRATVPLCPMRATRGCSRCKGAAHPDRQEGMLATESKAAGEPGRAQRSRPRGRLGEMLVIH